VQSKVENIGWHMLVVISDASCFPYVVWSRNSPLYGLSNMVLIA